MTESQPKTTNFFHFYGPITPFSTQNLRNFMLDAVVHQAGDFVLLLSSEGGDLNSGFTMYNFLRSFPAPITAVNMGTVESIAVPIFLAADKRLAVQQSRFLLHSFHWNYNARVDYLRMAENAGSLDFDAERYAQIFEDRTKGCKVPVDVRKCLAGRSQIIGSAAAEDAGLITAAPIAPETVITSDNAIRMWWPATV